MNFSGHAVSMQYRYILLYEQLLPIFITYHVLWSWLSSLILDFICTPRFPGWRPYFNMLIHSIELLCTYCSYSVCSVYTNVSPHCKVSKCLCKPLYSYITIVNVSLTACTVIGGKRAYCLSHLVWDVQGVELLLPARQWVQDTQWKVDQSPYLKYDHVGCCSLNQPMEICLSIQTVTAIHSTLPCCISM